MNYDMMTITGKKKSRLKFTHAFCQAKNYCLDLYKNNWNLKPLLLFLQANNLGGKRFW